jgi:NAD(P)-dependent dehydrogenase (short-subunit alcohol dehydrogenase family)
MRFLLHHKFTVVYNSETVRNLMFLQIFHMIECLISALVGFTRSYAPMISAERITLNAICPNVVQTSISSAAFYEAVASNNALTPMETLMEQFQGLMGANNRNGLIVECGPNGAALRDQVEYMDEKSKLACDMLEARGEKLYGLSS